MSDYEKVCLIRGDGGSAIRGILDRIGDKWSLLLIATLDGGRMRFGDLKQRGTTVPNGEEQLGVLVAADRAVAPVHWNYSSARRAQGHAGCQRSFLGCL